MSGSFSPATWPASDAAVVAELRAAGCVFAEDEAALLVGAARGPAELAAMVARRVAGLPLEQILGWAEFCGLRIALEPGVFVPRRRTELLVRSAAATIGADAPDVDGTPDGARNPVVVDLCCGSGAVGVALAALLGQVELYAVDVDPAAARCARRNVEGIGGQVFEGDLFAPLPASLRGRVDVLVANAPYVPTAEIRLMPAEARLHEPRVALDGGADGLDLQRRVIDGASRWLAPGGHLLVETSERQAPHTLEAFVRSGLVARVLSSDELDATVVVGSRAARVTGADE